jgi:hypothetical protein
MRWSTEQPGVSARAAATRRGDTTLPHHPAFRPALARWAAGTLAATLLFGPWLALALALAVALGRFAAAALRPTGPGQEEA